MNNNISTWLFEQNKEEEVLKKLIIENIRVLNAKDGNAQLELETTNDNLNVHDIIHGGVLFTLADSSAGAACVSLGKKVVTLNSSINYIKGAKTRRVISNATVLHSGKSTFVVNVDVYSQEDVLLCTSTFTMFVIGTY